MKKVRINDLPKAIAEKQLSKKEGVNIIWIELYTHPIKYGLVHFSEDQKSDFLLGMHKIFERLFDKFIPGTLTFQAYLMGCVSNYKMSFLRRQAERETKRKTLNAYLLSEFEEKEQKYNIELPEDDENLPRATKTLAEIAEKQKGTSAEKRCQRVAELTALVLMMKACKDIDDDTINSVSKFTGVDKALLLEKVQELKESMQKKEEHSQELISKRNNAFYFHRKYMQEMLSPSSDGSRLETLRSRYEKQTRKWKIHNETLSLRASTPSNEEIARILGLKPRTVSFYINHAKKNSFLDS